MLKDPSPDIAETGTFQVISSEVVGVPIVPDVPVALRVKLLEVTPVVAWLKTTEKLTAVAFVGLLSAKLIEETV